MQFVARIVAKVELDSTSVAVAGNVAKKSCAEVHTLTRGSVAFCRSRDRYNVLDFFEY